MITGLDLGIMALALPGTVGVVQLLKTAQLPARWAGLAALPSGIVIGVVLALAGVGDTSVAAGAIAGFFSGLSAAGAYSGAKSAVAG